MITSINSDINNLGGLGQTGSTRLQETQQTEAARQTQNSELRTDADQVQAQARSEATRFPEPTGEQEAPTDEDRGQNVNFTA